MSGLRHVVMFRWAEGTTEEQQSAVAERLAELPDLIPEIESYTLGRNAGINPGGYDFGLVADFADREGYLAYRDHPAHRAVIDELIAPNVAERAAIQFER